jgi:hypothetical protein
MAKSIWLAKQLTVQGSPAASPRAASRMIPRLRDICTGIRKF